MVALRLRESCRQDAFKTLLRQDMRVLVTQRNWRNLCARDRLCIDDVFYGLKLNFYEGS